MDVIGAPRLLGTLLCIIRPRRCCSKPLRALRFFRSSRDLEYAINRELYPTDEYPAGQLFYYENLRRRKKKWSRIQSEY